MKQRKIFIAGTDTEVGKTFFTCALIRALKSENTEVMAFKPVAAGCEFHADDAAGGKYKNEDALAIIDALDSNVEYERVNPIALKQPIAPHIAAQNEGVVLSTETLKAQCKLDESKQAFVLVEGAGGWFVPLNDSETIADYVVAESFEVVLVVGLKLGCINHALLTQQAIKAAGLKLIGWVANHIDPQMLEQQANIKSLQSRLDCPLIAEIPFIEGASSENNTADLAAKYVRIRQLID